jgi:hypothetical protein
MEQSLMHKVASEIVEQTLALDRRAMSDGPPPDQRELAKVMLPFVLSLTDEQRQPATMMLILLVKDILRSLPLDDACLSRCLYGLIVLLPKLLPSVGLDL